MCNHPKLMSVNCVIKCAVCGAVMQEQRTAPEEVNEQATVSISGRKIGFDAELRKRRTRKKGESKE